MKIQHLKQLTLGIAAFTLLSFPVQAQETNNNTPWLQSMTIEGGPIGSKHIQSGDPNFREGHTLAVAKFETRDYGTWGLYLLTPNSVDKTSFGVGYVTNPWTIPMGPVDLELTGALGLVTGYQDYPVPLLAGEARFVLYRAEKWDAGLAMAATPYVMEERRTNNNKFGVVVTSPFLSLRYKFK